MSMKRVVIGSTERGILYRDKRFVRILEPGTYRFLGVWSKISVDIIDIGKTPELKGPIAALIAREFSTVLERSFVKVTTGPREVAVVYQTGRAGVIVEPSSERLFWRGLSEVTVKRFDIAESYEIDGEILRDIAALGEPGQVLLVTVPEQGRGLLLEAGVIVRELSPGRYGFWRSQRQLEAEVLDTRLRAIDVTGQEMLTKDKVSLRINLSVSYRLVDAAKAKRSLSDTSGEIYRLAQLALRQAVGEKTLDELLENKELLNRALQAELVTTLGGFGVEASSVGLKDIILPGEMRTLLNQVVEAEKAAQAQTIRRREETAATRSLLNTARMMEHSPVLLRLKEIEAVERISEKIQSLTVYDGLEGVMQGLVSLTKK